mgnify:CR=1 FL=1
MKKSLFSNLIRAAATSGIAIAMTFALVSCKDDGANTTAAGDSYPLTTCVVSGEALGSMGEPIVINHEGTTVKFCCDGCIDDFKADPAPYLAKLAAAGSN